MQRNPFIEFNPTAGEKTTTNQFTTVDGGLVSECTIDLVPVQDLHGYVSPWVGGAGKNKLPLVLADIKASNISGTWNDNVYTNSGLKYTVLTDDNGVVTAIKISETATNHVDFNIPFTGIAIGNYIANGSADGGSGATFDVYFWNRTTSSRVKKWDGITNSASLFSHNDDAEVQVPNLTDVLEYRIRIKSGYTANNLLFYPMLRLSTESDATFEPYSNICPVSGHTNVNLDVKDGTNTTIESFSVSIGSTVYDGYVDLVSGVMKATHKILVMDGTTDGLKFTSKGGGTSNNYYLAVSDGYLFGKTGAGWLTSDEMTSHNMIDSHYVCISGGSDNIGFAAYIGSGGTVLQPRIQFSSASAITTVALANQWLSDQYSDGTPLQIVYPLATPTTIQLAPQQIESLVGQNNLVTPLSGQTIRTNGVKYKELFTFDDIKVLSVSRNNGWLSGIDANDLMADGFYHLGVSNSHLPNISTQKDWSTMYVSGVDTRDASQIFISNTSRIFQRVKSNDTWGSWNELALKSNIPVIHADKYDAGTIPANTETTYTITFPYTSNPICSVLLEVPYGYGGQLIYHLQNYDNTSMTVNIKNNANVNLGILFHWIVVEAQ